MKGEGYGKKAQKEKAQKNSQYLPPAGASRWFSPEADEDFQKKHPVGYGFLVALAITALLAPMAVYGIYVELVYGDQAGAWIILGAIGSFVVGIGLFNFVAIIRQYLGHLASIVSFLLGGICIWISLMGMSAP